MLDLQDFTTRPLTARLRRARLKTLSSLLLERLTAGLWRLLTWAGLFGALWLFQIPALFGAAGGVTALVFFLAGIFYFAWKDLRDLRWPKAYDIDRRIEQETGVRHRPLAAMNDKLANPQKHLTRYLWDQAKFVLLDVLRIVRSGQPRAFMAERDPYAIRLGVILFLALGFYTAGPSWDERLMQGLLPVGFERGGESPDRLSLWVTPPEYTGLAPIIIKGKGDGKILDVPQGSRVKITVRGGRNLPQLVMPGDGKDVPFVKAEDGNYILEAPLPDGDVLKVSQGLFTRAQWPFHVIPDTPPTITLKGEVEVIANGSMRIPLEVEDDYGVKNLNLSVTLNQSMNPDALGEPVNDSRIVMSPPHTKLPIQPVYDLTPHPWAGQPVSIVFTAEDGLGQKTASEPIIMPLPEREFMHPVAQKIIALRKELILKPKDNFESLTERIEDILFRPGLYLDDKTVFLALRSAASRLFWADPPTRDDGKAVAGLLWDTALRVEGGEISIAARNLRDAQRNLEAALDNPATAQEEIQKRIAELRSAMAEYFMEMQREMQKRMAEGQQFPVIPPEMMGQMLDPEALSNFLEQLEARMMAGDRKAAQEMMGQLQRLMDMMDPSMTAPLPEDMQMMAEGINQIQELVRQQRELKDRTQNQLSSVNAMDIPRDFGDQLQDETLPQDWDMGDMPPAPEAPEPPPSAVLNTSPLQGDQEKIRHDLGEVMTQAGEKLGQVPENLGNAEQEMRGSSQALGGNNPIISIMHQEEALKQLEQAQKDLSQQLMARLQQMTGMSLMGGGMKFDPLGRPYGGDGQSNGLFGSPVKIPDEGERKKAQEILKLLRRRSSELDRPDEELDYYKRLLRQF